MLSSSFVTRIEDDRWDGVGSTMSARLVDSVLTECSVLSWGSSVGLDASETSVAVSFFVDSDGFE